jgi:heterodisulfide reductase subunit B
MNKTNRHIAWNEKERAKINEALSAGGLSYNSLVKVRHPLDILVNDVGLMEIKTRVKVPLRGLKVAPYYGCQIVRPHGYFDDRDDPMTMDNLFAAVGAETVPYSGKVRCCGAMLMTTDEKVALKLSMNLVEAAVDSGADIIATACPLCQMNLEAYQNKINEMFDRNFNMPVVYFTHIVGMALGIKPSEMGLNNMIIDPAALTDRTEEAMV